MKPPLYGRMRSAWAAAGLALASVASTPANAETHVEMYRTSGCACCLIWAKRLEAAGFKVTSKDLTMGQLMRMKLDAGLKHDQAGCHTARVGGYIVEGHVPPREIKRMLSERPEAAGLTVPGMPIGSPGMESGDRQDAYDVVLFRKDEPSEIFASYPAKK